MKKNTFIVLCTLFLSCYSIERDCEAFQTGRFKFTNVINGELKVATFIRDSLYEIEHFENVVDTAAIRWVNNCEFILTRLSPTSNQDKKPIRIRIIKTSASGYTFEYGIVGDEKNKKRGFAEKIK